MATLPGGVPASLTRSSSILAILLMLIVLASGGLLRLVAALSLTPHVDEASSLLAAHAVAERGLPILPSGTVYLQGATLSYLLAPFIWLGYGDLADLWLLRLVIVVAGIAAVWFSYRLASTITGSVRTGVVMAMLVAFDPLSIQWSGHLRMYGLLQVLTIALALAWALVLARGATWPRLAAVVVLFWAAVFTHVGAALLGPAMFIAAVVVHRRALIHQGRVGLALALSAVGAGTLMVLNRVLGSASVGDPQQKSSSKLLSFVGDNLLTPFANSPDEFDWMALTRGGNLFWLIPGVLVAIATVAGGRLLLRKRSLIARTGAVVVLTMYWFPMAAVGLFTSSPKERYVLHSHLLGYLFAAVIIVSVIRRWQDARAETPGIPPVFAQVFSVAIAVTLISGATWRLQNPVVHPDHHAAMEYITEHHVAGEPIISSLPAIAYLAIDEEDRDDLYFLAGEQDQSRARRYTRYTGEGVLIDYWVGADALVSSTRLQVFLRQHPDAWVVVDRERLQAEWAYAGVVEDILRESTVPVAITAGGGLVLRPAQLSEADNARLWSLALDGNP
ncbi:MAG TPA: hypothetical protein VGR29_07360 [Thermomicrobiales bacterium]|nr:hypothetical protein [Thermomicrobiales bacterium]